MSSLPLPLPTRVLVRYLEDDVTRAEAEEIEGLINECSVSRRRLDELRDLQTRLRAPDPDLATVDVAPAVLSAIRGRLPDGPVRSRLRRWTAIGMGLAAAASLALAVYGRWSDRGDAALVGQSEDEFRAKSAAPEAANERWVDLALARVSDTGEPRPLGDRLSSRDGLLVSYSNLGPRPFAYLMVFAVDAAGHVYWFYPAYERPDSDPVSVAIAVAGRKFLPDVIHHDLPPGPLAIYGVFSRAPLKVSEIERTVGALVRDGGWKPLSPAPLPIPEATSAQLVLRTRVIP